MKLQQVPRYREETSGSWLGAGRGRRYGAGDKEIRTTVYKISKPHGYAVQHREYSFLL